MHRSDTKRKLSALLRQSMYERSPKLCKQCGKSIPYRLALKETRKFCSKMCAVIMSRKVMPQEITPINISGVQYWTRQCPTCQCTILHTRKLNCEQMFNKNRNCRSCGKKKQFQNRKLRDVTQPG